MTAAPHMRHGAPQRLVPQKWRPSLAMIVTAVLTTVLGLPLLGLFVFRQLEDRLIQPTESVPIAEYAALSAAVAGVTLIVGFLFWRNITRPIHQLVRAMRAIGSGDREAIVAPAHHGTRELAMLSQSFLEMAQRLDERADYITTFAAHVSHELKSPLSSIRGAAELLRDSGEEMPTAQRRGFLDNILDDTERLTALVLRLRELARADNPQIGQTTLDGVIATARSSFPALSIVAQGELNQAVRISADNAGILISHLADNALRHNARSLRIVAQAWPDRVAIIVRNDGAPIADNDRDRVFTPFFTTRRETGGTGMGLAIVRSMLRAHGGDIRLLSVDPVAFEMELPRG